MRLVALAALALCLTGCTATISTNLTVEGGQVVVESYTVRAAGELAEALRQDPATDQGILEILSGRTGGVPERRDTSAGLVYTVSPAGPVFASELTGVASASVEETAGTTTATVQLQPPSELQKAIAAAAEGEPDAAALEITYAASTLVEVVVHMPGDVSSVEGPYAATIDGPVAVVSVPVADIGEATMKFSSRAGGGPDGLLLLGVLLVAAGAIYGVFSWARHRRIVRR